MDRDQKTQAVAELNRNFNEVGVVVITRNHGMTVAQSTALRTKMREAGATYKVSKNRLAKIAAQGTDYAGVADMLTGPVGIASSRWRLCPGWTSSGRSWLVSPWRLPRSWPPSPRLPRRRSPASSRLMPTRTRKPPDLRANTI